MVSEYATPACAARFTTRCGLKSLNAGVYPRPVFDIQPQIGKLRISRQTKQAIALELHIVIVVQIVDTQHLIATFKQPDSQGVTNKTCRTLRNYKFGSYLALQIVFRKHPLHVEKHVSGFPKSSDILNAHLGELTM